MSRATPTTDAENPRQWGDAAADRGQADEHADQRGDQQGQPGAVQPGGSAVSGQPQMARGQGQGGQARGSRPARATPAIAVNAFGYQVAAAAAALLGGPIADSTAGPRPIYLVAAALTAGALLLSLVVLGRRDRAPDVGVSSR